MDLEAILSALREATMLLTRPLKFFGEVGDNGVEIEVDMTELDYITLSFADTICADSNSHNANPLFPRDEVLKVMRKMGIREEYLPIYKYYGIQQQY